MTENSLVLIENTAFKDCFENSPEGEVFLLNKNDANKFWNRCIDTRATSYFGLPDDNWIISGERKFIGIWIDAYNNDNNAQVSNILRKTFSWSGETTVWFCLSKEVIFKSNWQNFLDHWDCYIASDDDCPILISEQVSISREALVFRAIGDMHMISSSRS